MGIPGFSTWLKQRYPEAFKDSKTNHKFDHVYIDLQSTLHTVTRKARSRQGFHILLHRRLDELLASLSPTKRVIFAMDGPAPLAKLLEQRRRRRREADKLEITESSSSSSSSSSAPSSSSRNRKDISGFELSSLYLTTGTLFMLEIHNSLSYYICKRLTDPKYSKMSGLHYELSDSTVKGEGELKILSRLLNLNNQNNTKKQFNTRGELQNQEQEEEEAEDEFSMAISSTTPQPGDNHVIVGADSDLMIMSMISGQTDVYVYDDNPRAPIKPNANRRPKPRSSLFNRNVLESIWRRDHLTSTADQSDVISLALDLSLLAIISSGNDYLPATQGLQLESKGRPGLWDLYLDMKNQEEWKDGAFLVTHSKSTASKSDADNRKEGGGELHINGEMLAALLQRYQEQKYAPLTTPAADNNNNNDGSNDDGDVEEHPNAAPIKSTVFFDSYRRKNSWFGAWSYGKTAAAEKATAAALLLASAPPFSSTDPVFSRLPADPVAYTQGLEWVLDMYATGSIHDYRFSYPAMAPSVFALINHLRDPQRNSATSISVELPHREGHHPRRQPLIPAACALALLPARGRRQAATPLRHLMDADSPVAEIYAVCKECQRMAGDIRVVAVELEGVRKELAAVQAELGSEAFDSEGRLHAEGDLAAAVERWEGAGDRLKQLLSELSRSQQEHLREMHPYKPFPTDELEAAVRAVPKERYPPHERRLAKFGRELMFLRDTRHDSLQEEASSLPAPGPVAPLPSPSYSQAPSPPRVGAPFRHPHSVNHPQEREIIVGDEFLALPGWLRDCSRFASSYPKAANATIIRRAADAVRREMLPLHPYMQPNSMQRQYPGSNVGGKTQQRQRGSSSGSGGASSSFSDTTNASMASTGSGSRFHNQSISQQQQQQQYQYPVMGSRFGSRSLMNMTRGSTLYNNSTSRSRGYSSSFYASSSSSSLPLFSVTKPKSVVAFNSNALTLGHGAQTGGFRSVVKNAFAMTCAHAMPLRCLRMLRF